VLVCSERLDAVASVVRGVSFDKSEVRTEPSEGTVPILRAGNIADLLDTSADLVWVPSVRVKPDQRLRLGDIAICMSSGSQTVVGKSAALRSEWFGSVGAFCAIVRPKPEVVDPAYLALYMRSDRFRSWTRTSEGANIKNIRHSELLTHLVPVPPLIEQRRIVDLLSRAENIVRMRREAETNSEEFIRTLFLDMFGDPATNPKGWGMGDFRAHIDMLTGYPFKSNEFVAKGDTVRLCRGANVLPQRIDWSDARYWPRARTADFAEYSLECGDIVLAMDRPWISTGLKVARLSQADLPALLVQRVSRIRPKRTVRAGYIYSALCHPTFTSYCNGLKTETLVPHISPQDILSFRLPIPPQDLQDRFALAAERVEEITDLQARARLVAESAFGSLLASVFGEAR
jgi:type I restriction enzyme, S subunit